MKMADQFEALKGKWVNVVLDSGSFTMIQGIIRDVGDDYIGVLEREDANIKYINNSKIVTLIECKLNDKGKPKIIS
ncbi:MAG: hypothetical protein II167_01865 [Clostridiales bacterium]|nr:hypothetical protein [Clostridiales bacterium]